MKPFKHSAELFIESHRIIEAPSQRVAPVHELQKEPLVVKPNWHLEIIPFMH